MDRKDAAWSAGGQNHRSRRELHSAFGPPAIGPADSAAGVFTQAEDIHLL